MSIQVKDANGAVQNVKTLDDAFPASAQGATQATSEDIKALADSVLLMAEMIRNLMPMPDVNDRMRCRLEIIDGNLTLSNLSTLNAFNGLPSTGLVYMAYNQPALQLITNQVNVS